MVPDISKQEWVELVAGETVPRLTSLSLQMKLNAIRLDLKLKRIDQKTAATIMYDACVKNEKAYEKDLIAIFGHTYLLMSK
jgi:hypothetical protein